MQELAEIEEIKKLKARYFRTLDTNDWDEFEACLTEDCTASYSDGKKVLESGADIVAFMKRTMSGDGLLSMHTGHHPEISIAPDGDSATGRWYLQDLVIHRERNVRLYGTGIYDDEYVNVDGKWLISRTGYSRVFECVEPLGEHNRILRNMFAEQA